MYAIRSYYGNANYAWIQHFLYHLKPTGGLAGFVLSKGALTSKTSGEGDIRKALIDARLVDCIVNLPAKLFLNTQIPASLWFLRRGKTYRKDELLFIGITSYSIHYTKLYEIGRMNLRNGLPSFMCLSTTVLAIPGWKS